MQKITLYYARCVLAIILLIFGGTAAWSQTTISGTIRTTGGLPMPGVVVGITGTVNDFAITDTSGHYEKALPQGGAYTVAPQCHRNPLNGVSTFDLVLISKHVTGIELFTSPYQYIAADINNTGQISLLDSLEGRKLILGIYNEFPANPSWRFVRAGYVFPNPDNPFTPPFPESYITANLNGSVSNVDFTGVKIGDINLSAIPVDLTDSTYLSWIDGTVAEDQNTNCQLNSGEMPLKNWLIHSEGLYGNFYGKTNANGTYSMGVPPGTYVVELLKPNNYWDPCAATVPGVVTNLLGHTAVNFPVQVETECPFMRVDLSALFLRRCYPNTYTVQYCNEGTVVAEDARVEVTFDSFLQVQSSSLPWTVVNGQTYTFPLGDVSPNDCGSFTITALLSCDADTGQTHCSTAKIFPDTICGSIDSLWSGAELEVRGNCDGDNVIFTITNTGEDMTAPEQYIVIEDIMIQMTGGNILLNKNQSETVTVPANGSTWRLELPQVDHHPWGGLVTAAVEGCGLNSTGAYSQGFVTQFPNGDDSPGVDEDCQANISSFDPNDKQGFPFGVREEHYIPKGQDITYKIRFQNTGTDTAFNIMVLDTLSAMLDRSSFRPGASSHPYTYNVLGSGIVQFLFQDILLPDSNKNEAASHGFVQFSIRPRTDLPNNSVIENEAAIYFDFNAPVITNRTWHTVGEKFLNTSTVFFQPGLDLDVYPNPASTSATLFLKSARPLEGRLYLSDMQGRIVQEQAFQTNVFDIHTAGLPPGLYFFRLKSETGKALAAGKLAVVRN